MTMTSVNHKRSANVSLSERKLLIDLAMYHKYVIQSTLQNTQKAATFYVLTCGYVVAQLAGKRTCDSQAAGSNPG